MWIAEAYLLARIDFDAIKLLSYVEENMSLYGSYTILTVGVTPESHVNRVIAQRITA